MTCSYSWAEQGMQIVLRPQVGCLGWDMIAAARGAGIVGSTRQPVEHNRAVVHNRLDISTPPQKAG